MIQQVVPNNFIGRVISFDMGFNLNLALTATSLIFGLLLIDVAKFEAHDCSLTLLIGAGVCGIIAIIWFVLSWNVDSHDTVPVDDNGNDIVEEKVEQENTESEQLVLDRKKKRNSAHLIGVFFGHAKEIDLTGAHEPITNSYPSHEHIKQ
jgi:hypothetical protein